MVANNDIPDIMDSIVYTADSSIDDNPNEPIFLERALYLHDHGYFKELTTLELRDKLRSLYRDSEKLRVTMNNEDVWK